MSPARADRPRYGWADAAIVLAMFAGTIVYLAALPRYLGAADEAVHLYDAKRILQGEVIYRDFFTVITPGFMYLMAALFKVFGTTIATARIGAAVVHGITVVAVYLSCRRLGVRRVLAWPPAVAYLLVCEPAWPIASQHWLSTMFCTLALLGCIGQSRARPRSLLVPAVAIGLLILVQQQRGLFVAAGTFVWVVVDYGLERWYRSRREAPGLVTRLAFLVGGAAVMVIPVMVAVIAAAGADRVWRALVLFPIFNYGAVTHCPWGHVNLLTAGQAKFTFPLVLAYLPLVLPVTFTRALALTVRRRREEEARHLVLLLTFCLTSMLSISYFPDFIHIAFIAPAFFVTIGESVEWLAGLALGRSPADVAAATGSRLRRAAAGAVTLGLLAAFGAGLDHNLQRLRATYPIGRSTAFGRVDFPDADEAGLYDTVNTLMRDSGARYLYAYPVAAHLYLMIDVDNPTSYGWFIAPFYDADQVRDAMSQLRVDRLPYVLLFAQFTRPDDPVVAWIHQHYDPLPGAGRFAKTIFRRKTADDTPAPRQPADAGGASEEP